VSVLPSFPCALESVAESDLVERAKHDPLAFGELYRRHRANVHRFVSARVRSQHDAEDLVSDVFLRALTAIGRFRDTGAPFGAWLQQIATYAVIDQHRRASLRHQDDIDAHLDLVSDLDLEDVVARRDRVRRVSQAARRLPRRQQVILALRFGEDLKVADIAREVGLSRAGAQGLLHRATARVRAEVVAAADGMELAS
jgi:RNA polymerase sigma-70 factor (ECF subfamily)